MKKGTIIILSIITLVLTFIFAEIFSIYHFGSAPTLLTSLYIISIFAIFEYLSISITYIVRKLIKKEKLETKKIIGLILLFPVIFDLSKITNALKQSVGDTRRTSAPLCYIIRRLRFDFGIQYLRAVTNNSI